MTIEESKLKAKLGAIHTLVNLGVQTGKIDPFLWKQIETFCGDIDRKPKAFADLKDGRARLLVMEN